MDRKAPALPQGIQRIGFGAKVELRDPVLQCYLSLVLREVVTNLIRFFIN